MRAFFFLAVSGVVSAANLDERIAREAEALKPKLIEIRRDFHMYPELSNREERTARVIAERLRALGFTDVRTGVAKHGVVALLKGGKAGGVIAVRADMDALPVTETIDVPYKSKNAGAKHACGHDVHLTVQLGVAEILSKLRNDVPGTIKFIFQPAEEGAPQGEKGGARWMIEEGVLENPKPTAIFGLHSGPDFRAGSVGYTSGPFLASSDTFKITVTGRSVHGAYPHLGVDPIPVAAEIIQALQTIRSRRIVASQPFVLTIGKIEGGNRHNIIAPDVQMLGTMRTLDEEVRSQAKMLMKNILDGVAGANGVQTRLEWYDAGNAVTFNSPPLAHRAVGVMQRVLGEKNVQPAQPQMGAEDFSLYVQLIPGFFYWLGIANPEKGIGSPLHTAAFDVDENSLVTGVRVMSALLLDSLEAH
jgi:amidohydrolase